MKYDQYRESKKKEAEKVQSFDVLKKLNEKKDIDYTELLEKIINKEVDLGEIITAIKELPRPEKTDFKPVVKAIKDIKIETKETVLKVPKNEPDKETHKLLKEIVEELKKKSKQLKANKKKQDRVNIRVIEIQDKINEMENKFNDSYISIARGSSSAQDTSTDTTNFNNNLSVADDTVQKALDTIDELSSGYTEQEVDDLLDEKQDNLVSGSNIKTINGESVVGSGDLTVLGQAIDSHDWEQALVTPMGQAAFLRGTGNYAAKSGLKTNFRPQGNMTLIKRFHAGIKAYSSYFINLKNEDKDQILIYNNGYSFIAKFYKAGAVVFEYSASSGSIFPSQSKITCFMRIDFDLEELTIEYSGYSNTIDATGIRVLKDSIFDYMRAGINAYYGNIKDWFLFMGLYRYSGMSKMFSSNSNQDDILPKPNLVQKSCGKQLTSGTPTSVNWGVTRSFVDGKAHFTTVNGKPYLRWYGLNWSSKLGYAAHKQFLFDFSLDINVGSVDFIVGGQTPIVTLCRAVEKNTGQVIEVWNKTGVHSSIMTVPVGEWRMYIQSEASSALHYALRMGNASADLDMDIYDDYKASTTGISLSQHAFMADYYSTYCPYTKQVLTGSWGLTNNY